MPIIDTQIIAEPVQHDGRRRYRYRYTFSEGKEAEFDRNMTPPGFDAVADAAAKIPDVEAGEKDAEVRRAYQAVIDGADYLTELTGLLFNTATEFNSFIAKSTANKLRSLDNQTIQDELHQVIAFPEVFNASGPVLAGWLGNVSVSVANGWKGMVQALRIGVMNYAPTVPTYPEVE